MNSLWSHSNGFISWLYLCIVVLVRTASDRNKRLRCKFHQAMTVPVFVLYLYLFLFQISSMRYLGLSRFGNIGLERQPAVLMTWVKPHEIGGQQSETKVNVKKFKNGAVSSKLLVCSSKAQSLITSSACQICISLITSTLSRGSPSAPRPPETRRHPLCRFVN